MNRRLLAFIALATLVVALMIFGSEFRVEGLREVVAAAGPWGPPLFVLSFAVLEGLGFPGIFFILVSTAIWPTGFALFLNWAGAVGASVVGASVARGIGRDWISGRLPDRLQRFDRHLAENALVGVILVRLVFFLAPWAHWGLGLSRVRFAPLVVGSAIGFLPGIALMTWAGRELLDWIETESIALWIPGGVAMILLLLFFLWRNRIRARPSTPTLR
jgi:uncharacterized membrane protein YdjX (TVP38/TMEM64 family)